MPWGVPHNVGFVYNLDLNLGEDIELRETVSGLDAFSSSALWVFHGEYCVEVFLTRLSPDIRNCYGTLRKKTAFKSPQIAV